MAEENEGQDTAAEASGAGVDPPAVALALGGASREDAGAFLKKQSAIADLQMMRMRAQDAHIKEEERLKLSHLRIRRFSDFSKMAFEISVGLFFLAVVGGFGTMVWSAAHANGLLIEPFSVPPDLAQRGMTGQVVAAKLLDHLSEMQAQTTSERPAETYANDWGQAGIKLDIPETGISVTELDDFLREKLGHDTHITGEIVRTASGVSLTARTGMEGAESVTGSEADLDGLVRQLSEKVYRLTQPYRYAIYLASHDRLAEAVPVMKAVAETGPTRLDRAFGYGDWSNLAGEQDGVDTSLRLSQRAMAVDLDNVSAQMNLVYIFAYKSLPEQAVRENQKVLTLLASNKLGMYRKGSVQAGNDPALGDFRDAAQMATEGVQAGTSLSPDTSAGLANLEAAEHDLAAARATVVDTANYRNDYQAGYTALDSLMAKMRINSEAQNWAGLLSDADAFAPVLQKYPGLPSWLPTQIVPLTAYAEARLGKMADAQKHIAATPADCYDCLIARARIAEVQGQHGRADYWFARAIDGQKSIPFAYAYWGQALLERGDPDGAIAKFTLANQNGPKFADPLEMWGEALMAKKQSDQALAKFTEAEKYAPNWGRLHLKWAEALGYAGKKDEAQKQFALAAGLDLSSADKAELAKVSHG